MYYKIKLQDKVRVPPGRLGEDLKSVVLDELQRQLEGSIDKEIGIFTTLKYVKVFEYVKGAKIKGDGIIEIDLESDQGRKFTYSQRSTDGYFTVPYSTTGNNYGTKVLSDYRIRGTQQAFKVSEDAVMNGLNVN